MRRETLNLLLVLLFAALLAVGAIACSDDDGSADGDAPDGDGDAQDSCTEGDVRCEGNDVYACGSENNWEFAQSCSLMGSSYVCLNGECQYQNTPDGDVPDGDVSDGDVTDGDVTEADMTDGDTTDGDLDSDMDGDALVDGDADPEPDGPDTFTLLSSSFVEGDPIPAAFGCNPATPMHQDTPSLPFAWYSPPEGTKTFILLMIDEDQQPDGWTHWAVINLPVEIRELPFDASATGMPGVSTIQLDNSWGNKFYEGPCPSAGQTHNYRIYLFAMQQLAVNLATIGKSTETILADIAALEPLDQAELSGTFSNQFDK